MKKNLKPYLLPLIVYMSLCIFIFIFQRNLLYFPYDDTNKSDHWTIIKNENEKLGLVKRSNQENIVVVFHGNAGSASMRDYYLDIIPNNYRLIVAEYPGFGINTGEKINQENIIRKARALMKEIKPSEKLVIIGESIGSAVAAQMAKEFNANKLILVTSYNNLQSVAQSKFWFLPAYYLLKDKWDTVESINGYKGDTLLIVAQRDNVIPPKFADKLYESINSNKTKIVVDKANHNDWLDYISDKQITQIIQFMQH